MQWIVRQNQNGSNELLHYGVKGMKWGIRKEYEPKGRPKTKLLNSVTKIKKTDNGDSVIKTLDKKDYQMRQDLLDEGYSVAKYASSSEALYEFNNLPRFNQRLGEEQQRQATNHNAPNNNRQNNCFECTMAYEMRRRGYNVQANEVRGGYAFEAMHAFDIKNSFTIKMSQPSNGAVSNRTLAEEAYRSLEEQCLSYGDGARGMMGIYYAEPYSGGHAMSWVVENGKFKIIDNQNNSIEGYESFLYSDGNIDVYRLDNAEVLPGVTDFIEPFEATAKEKHDAQKRYKQQQKVWKKEHRANGKTIVDKIIDNIGKQVSNLVSKGKEILDGFFGKK